MNNTQTDDLLTKFGDGSGFKSQTKKPENKTDVLNLKQGETVFRILPPMFSCVSRNIWASFYARHWVVCGNGTRMPVLCTKVFDQKTRQYLDTCHFCKVDEPKRKLKEQTYQALLSKKEQLESSKDSASEEELIVLQDELEGVKEAYQVASSQYSPIERKFWANVMTQDGEVKLCGMPKTVFEALAGKKEEGDKFRKGGLFDKLIRTQQLDGVGVSGGVWLVVNRTGAGQFDTEYAVTTLNEVELTEVNGQKRRVEYIKECPLTEPQQLEALAKGKDLNTVFDYMKLSVEEQIRFVNSGYDSEVLFEMFNNKRPLVSQDLQNV